MVRSHLRQINFFLHWCEREGEGTGATAQLPNVPKKLPQVLSREEIRHLEDAAPSERDKLVVRTWPMRGTLHFVTAKDARWMTKLLAPRVIKRAAARHRSAD